MAPKAEEPAKPRAKFAPVGERPTLKALSEQIAGLSQALEQVKTTSTTAAQKVRTQALDGLMAGAEVKPAYRKFVATELGDVDLDTDAGKAKFDTVIQGWKKTMPEAFEAKAALPDSAWVKRLTERQEKGKDGRRRPTLLDSISPQSLATITERRGG